MLNTSILYWDSAGFSLIELLVVLIVMAVVSVAGIGAYQAFYSRHEDAALEQQMLDALNFARQAAISLRKPVTLEVSTDMHIQIKANARLLRAQQAHGSGHLYWRMFPAATMLQFTFTGLTGADNGTIWYCPNNAAPAAWALVVNKAGRVREGKTIEVEALSCNGAPKLG